MRPLGLAEIRPAVREAVGANRGPDGIDEDRGGFHDDRDFVAQEMPKPNWLVWIPKLGGVVSVTGYARNHGAVGRSAQVGSPPMVPGR